MRAMSLSRPFTRFCWSLGLMGLLVLAGCASAPTVERNAPAPDPQVPVVHPTWPVVTTHKADAPAETWNPEIPVDLNAVLKAGLDRAEVLQTQRLPALHRTFEAAQQHLDAPKASSKQRRQAEATLRDAEYQANRLTLDSGLQMNAVRRALEKHDHRCERYPDSSCAINPLLRQAWTRKAEAVWQDLTGPLVQWREAGKAAIARHPQDPSVPVDYRRGMPQCQFWDVGHPSTFTGI